MLTPLPGVPLPDIRRFWDKLKQRSIKSFALLFAVGLSLSLAVSACSSSNQTKSAATAPTANPSPQQSSVVRIGYQKYGTVSILKVKKNLDERLKAEGVSVRWLLFPASPQMLEAMTVTLGRLLLCNSMTFLYIY